MKRQHYKISYNKGNSAIVNELDMTSVTIKKLPSKHKIRTSFFWAIFKEILPLMYNRFG